MNKNNKNTMYIKRMVEMNAGPIEKISIDFPFDENNNPTPIIIVGENGTGKSTLLSNIVDSFYEMAGKFFTNVFPEGNNLGHQYYKTMSPTEIHVGKTFLFSYIDYSANSSIKYVFKMGNLSLNDFKIEVDEPSLHINWDDKKNYKEANIKSEDVELIWKNNVFCYFGPDRYEKPAWMGTKYFDNDSLHLEIVNNYNGILKNEISIKNLLSINTRWILDVIMDSRPDCFLADQQQLRIKSNIRELILLNKTRESLEQVLSAIIGESVCFDFKYRNSGGSRLSIVRKVDNSMYCPSLDSLSTGQLSLFNLFTTIVQYADNNNIMHSISLNEITGIVVIDEVELHLHSKLQKEVLPKLLSFFPKVQFIITTHSPLFLLGMRDVYGEDNIRIIEMPFGTEIRAEKYTEFQKAYNYLKETKTYNNDVENAIKKAIQTSASPLIVTEGSTDWKHMKAAYKKLRSDHRFCELFNGLYIDFLEYDPPECINSQRQKLRMCNKELVEMCKQMSKIPNHSKIIVIADSDDVEINKKLSHPEFNYKCWGNNVYSLVLPTPQHRTTTPNISIEHYYSDDEIKTPFVEDDGVTRRLYMGNEFDNRGYSQALHLLCEKKQNCGPNRIDIIDGSNGDKVTKLDDNNKNLALPKAHFAEFVLNEKEPSNSFVFDSFIPLFEIINEIINE